MSSILSSVKESVGVMKEYTEFDARLIDDINSVFFTLSQLGVGPKEGFSITGNEEDWDDYIPVGTNLQAVKSYMRIKVQLLFDPPSNSFTLTSMENQAKEYEWRFVAQVETGS